MLLTEYISGFLKTINDYSKTGLIISFDLTNDLRTEKIGLVKGYVVFSDEPILYFTEYLDVRYKIDKLSYSFHYQNKDGELIFRYDNSKHKPELTFYNHKHLRNGTISESFQPDVQLVLDEIMEYLL